MKLAFASIAALLATTSAAAQDDAIRPDGGTAAPRSNEPATKPGEGSGQTGVGIDAPKVDPKLLIDIFNAVTRPRRPPAPPPPAPLHIEPTAPVVGTVPIAPIVTTAPAPRPVAGTPVAVPREVKPRPSTPPK